MAGSRTFPPFMNAEDAVTGIAVVAAAGAVAADFGTPAAAAALAFDALVAAAPPRINTRSVTSAKWHKYK